MDSVRETPEIGIINDLDSTLLPARNSRAKIVDAVSIKPWCSNLLGLSKQLLLRNKLLLGNKLLLSSSKLLLNKLGCLLTARNSLTKIVDASSSEHTSDWSSDLLWEKLLLGNKLLLLNWGSKLLWSNGSCSCSGLGPVNNSKSFRGELRFFMNVRLSCNLLMNVWFSCNLNMLIWNNLRGGGGGGSQAN